ncbi:MAG TPA: glutathione S-transferase family protein [Polyangiales bacterium]|nr:glutathione S-transferase family protein [Polyangiales bacterium]
MTTHRLIGARVSLYTGKVRAYLQYKDIPFVEVAATREVYRDLIVPRTGVRFIPVLISDDDIAIQDSTEIIDFLERRYPAARVYPDGAIQHLVSLILETYADEWLVVPAMHYRWNVPENRAFAIAEFGRLSAPDASPQAQLEIGEKLAGPFAGALPALGVSEATIPAIETSYHEFLAEFDHHLASHPFLLGTRPSIADFGFFGPLYAHLYRDPGSGRLMHDVAPRVHAWVERMLEPVPRSGDFLPNDAVPDTLLPIIARMVREFGPVLKSTIDRLAASAAEIGANAVPRALGRHEFKLGAASGTRMAYPFNLWRWQRAHDQHSSLSSEGQERAVSLLAATSVVPLLEQPISPRLTRRDNRLFLA